MHVAQKVKQVTLVSLFGLTMVGCTSTPESIKNSKVDLLDQKVIQPMKNQGLMPGFRSTGYDVYEYSKATCQSYSEISTSIYRIKATCSALGGEISTGKYCDRVGSIISLADMSNQEIRGACNKPLSTGGYSKIKNSSFCSIPNKKLPIFYAEVNVDNQIRGAKGCQGRQYIFAEPIPGNEDKWIKYIDKRGNKSE
jgi:hypothetical protein